MSFKTNTHLEGTFTVLDVNGNVLSEQKNKILDWGMIRLTGHQNPAPSYVMSLADNLRKIWIGTSPTTVRPTDYKLGNYINSTDYTETNEPTITGTFYSLDNPGTPNEKMRINFVKGSSFEFQNTTLSQVNEVGISSNYEAPYGMYLTGTHEWVPTAAFPTLGGTSTNPNKKGGSGPYGTGWPAPHEDKLETSLFSRALLSSPVSVIKGDVLIIKYVLQVVTNAHLVGVNLTGANGSFPLDMTTITSGTNMPDRKTNIRRKFFYELMPDNTISGLLQYVDSYGRQGGRATSESAGGSTSDFYWKANLQFLPTLEVPSFGKNYIAMYDNFLSSQYATLGDGSSTANPLTSASSADYLGEVVISTGVYPPGGTLAANKPIWHIGKKSRTSFKTLSAIDTITCQHRFLFNPGEWVTNGVNASVRNFAFLRQNNDPSWTQFNVNTWDVQPLQADRSKVGMFTAFISEYNPYTLDSALYLGIDYTMTFTRS